MSVTILSRRSALGDVYRWWFRLVESTRDETGYVSVKMISDELTKNWNAALKQTSNARLFEITFNSEEDLTMFMLRWA